MLFLPISGMREITRRLCYLYDHKLQYTPITWQLKCIRIILEVLWQYLWLMWQKYVFFSSKLLLTLLQLEDNAENITITCLYDTIHSTIQILDKMLCIYSKRNDDQKRFYKSFMDPSRYINPLICISEPRKYVQFIKLCVPFL